MNDFEQVCYLFKNNANHAILKTKERLVRKLMEKHEKFKDDEGLWSLAMSRQMAEWREKNNLLDSYDAVSYTHLSRGYLFYSLQNIITGITLNDFAVTKYIFNFFHSTWCSLLFTNNNPKLTSKFQMLICFFKHCVNNRLSGTNRRKMCIRDSRTPLFA